MSDKIDYLIGPCRQLLTLAGENHKPRRLEAMSSIGLIDDGAVGFCSSSGLILYAGPYRELDRSLLADDCHRLDASNSVVLPGFVDSHTHLVFAGSRADEFYRRARGESYQEISKSGGGIQVTMSQTRAADVDQLYGLARMRLQRLYENGTTSVETKSGYGLSPESELRSLQVIQMLRTSEPGLVIPTYLGAHLIPPEYKDNRIAYIDQVIEQLLEVDEKQLAVFYDIFVDPLAFTRQEAQRIVDAAKSTGLRLRLHGDEFGDDGTAAWGVRAGAVSVDHLGGIGWEGISALADSDCVATLLPATMFFSGHGKYPPARQMIEAGCAIALATDLNPGSSLVYSMPFCMTLAVLKMGLSAEECIVASTINGAHALSIADRTGSLEPGKRADVIVADVPDYREIPYHVGANLISHVYINGRSVEPD